MTDTLTLVASGPVGGSLPLSLKVVAWAWVQSFDVIQSALSDFGVDLDRCIADLEVRPPFHCRSVGVRPRS